MRNLKSTTAIIVCVGLAGGASADTLTVKPGQTITGPVATSPHSASPAVSLTGKSPITVHDRGTIIAPSGRGIFTHETGSKPVDIFVTGSVNGEGTDCPGGVAGVPGSSLHGMIGCSGIHAQGDGTVSVTVDGTARGTSTAINGVGAGSGNVSIIAGPHSVLDGKYEFGIEAQETGTGNVDISTRKGSEVHSLGDGLFATNAGGGHLTIDNRGTVTAQTEAYNGVVNPKNEVGILAAISAAANGAINIVNSGIVHALGLGDGILAYDGGHISITNRGKVTAQSGFAIETINKTGQAVVTNSHQGTLIGAVHADGFTNHGVWAAKEDSDIAYLDLASNSTLRVTPSTDITIANMATLGGKLRLQDFAPGRYQIISGPVQGTFKSVGGANASVAYHSHSVVVTVKPPEEEDHHAAAAAGNGGGGGGSSGGERIPWPPEHLFAEW